MTSLGFISMIRAAELDAIAAHLPAYGQILELGAGTGKQALELRRRGFSIVAVDLAGSKYAQDRVYPIQDYDGRTLPFADASFDAVFSSNVLEHVPDLTNMHAEIRRVLKPGGTSVHLMPTHVWRLATSVGAFPVAGRTLLRARSGGGLVAGIRRLGRAVLQVRHGERGNAWSELWYFHPSWWRRNLRANGFRIVQDRPVGLFYTAEEMFGEAMERPARARLARWLGSATHLFEATPTGSGG